LILIPDDKTMVKYKMITIPIFDKILDNSYQSQTLSKTRDLLLPKLMSGEIRVPLKTINDND